MLRFNVPEGLDCARHDGEFVDACVCCNHCTLYEVAALTPYPADVFAETISSHRKQVKRIGEMLEPSLYF